MQGSVDPIAPCLEGDKPPMAVSPFDECYLDNASSHSMSPHKRMFVEESITPLRRPFTLRGATGNCLVAFSGHLKCLPSTSGMNTGYYVPELPVTLISLGFLHRCGAHYYTDPDSVSPRLIVRTWKDGPILFSAALSSMNMLPVCAAPLLLPSMATPLSSALSCTNTFALLPVAEEEEDEDDDAPADDNGAPVASSPADVIPISLAVLPNPCQSPAKVPQPLSPLSYPNAEQRRRCEAAELLHRALNHPSDQRFYNYLSRYPSSVTVADARLNRLWRGPCVQCSAGKMITHRPASDSPPATAPGQVISFDLNLLSVPTPNGDTHELKLVDEFSGSFEVVSVRSKNLRHVVEAIYAVIALYNSHGHSVKLLHGDAENINRALHPSLAALGVRLVTSVPGGHAHRVERYIRTNNEQSAATLAGLSYILPAQYEHFLHRAVADSMNMIPNTRSAPLTPEEVFTGGHRSLPPVPFGSCAMVLQLPDKRATIARNDDISPKSVPKAELGVCMGRDPLSPTNFIFLLANGKILPRRRPTTLLPWHFVPFNWIKKDYTPTVLIPTPRAPHMVSSDPRPHHFGPGLVRDVTQNVSVQGGLLSLPPEIPFIADPSQVDPRQQSVASFASIRAALRQGAPSLTAAAASNAPLLPPPDIPHTTMSPPSLDTIPHVPPMEHVSPTTPPITTSPTTPTTLPSPPLHRHNTRGVRYDNALAGTASVTNDYAKPYLTRLNRHSAGNSAFVASAGSMLGYRPAVLRKLANRQIHMDRVRDFRAKFHPHAGSELLSNRHTTLLPVPIPSVRSEMPLRTALHVFPPAPLKVALEKEITKHYRTYCSLRSISPEHVDANAVFLRPQLLVKQKLDGSVSARLPLDGSQQPADTYGDTYAGTSTAENRSFILALAIADATVNNKLWKLHMGKFDVPAAFLQEILHRHLTGGRQIITRMPKDLPPLHFPDGSPGPLANELAEVLRTIYGMKQSNALFTAGLITLLVANGYKSCPSDPLTFTKVCPLDPTDSLSVNLHVDDGSYLSTSAHLVVELKSFLTARYGSDMSYTDNDCGICAVETLLNQDGSVKMHMTKYITDFLHTAGMDALPCALTPSRYGNGDRSFFAPSPGAVLPPPERTLFQRRNGCMIHMLPVRYDIRSVWRFLTSAHRIRLLPLVTGPSRSTSCAI